VSSAIHAETAKRGGSEAAIQHHYDVGNAFYALWLDPTLTYSCALWLEGDDPRDLRSAQLRKLDYHLQTAGAPRARHVLDIGCGWGALLSRALQQPRVQGAVGLTLSDAQARHCHALGLPALEIRKESWTDHQPAVAYDSIISIGAFEHFASPGETAAQKVELYREFFGKCHGWLAPGGQLSLQTIAYGTLQPSEANAFINNEIFPDSELPSLHEIILAAQDRFEITTLRNDRVHYGQTCDHWFSNLRRNRAAAVALVGEPKVANFERYLRMSALGFYSGKICLLRLGFKPTKRTASARGRKSA
jgi:cyclopropane-fatty-acyl-phospholipid synthase